MPGGLPYASWSMDGEATGEGRVGAVLEDGDLDLEKMSTAQLQALVSRGWARRTNAEALAPVEEAVASATDAPTAEAV